MEKDKKFSLKTTMNEMFPDLSPMPRSKNNVIFKLIHRYYWEGTETLGEMLQLVLDELKKNDQRAAIEHERTQKILRKMQDTIDDLGVLGYHDS